MRKLYIQKNNFIKINILGEANAGKPILFTNEEKIGEIDFDRELVPLGTNVFAVIIKGDSMDQKSINDIYMTNGNYAIVTTHFELNNGDVVLAVLEGCATLKIFQRQNSKTILFPQSNNKIHTPIYLDETSNAFINGKVIAVIDNPLFEKF